jgi:hypothetical protein
MVVATAGILSIFMLMSIVCLSFLCAHRMCKNCQRDETCVICNNCYHASDHTGHDIFFYHSQAGGCCDCGDEDAWKPSGSWYAACMFPLIVMNTIEAHELISFDCLFLFVATATVKSVQIRWTTYHPVSLIMEQFSWMNSQRRL